MLLRLGARRLPGGLRRASTGPVAAYNALVDAEKIQRDGHQLEALVPLQRLHEEIVATGYAPAPRTETAAAAASSGGFMTKFAALAQGLGVAVGGGSARPSGAAGPVVSTFGSSYAQEKPTKKKEESAIIAEAMQSTAPRGVYVHGGVGTGKTFLMDMFFDGIECSKQRVHFHEFMLDVHKALHELKGRGEPLRRVADDIVAKGWLVCFDEFQVTDIADALVMKQLFEELFAAGGVVVATSNRAPSDLYANGIQRQLFLPFLPLLEARCVVHSVEASEIDYRLAIGASSDSANIYMKKGDDAGWLEAQERLIGRTPKIVSVELATASGRRVQAPRADLNARCAWFDFDELCGGNTGASDFLCLASAFDILFLDDVPTLDMRDLNRTRRFITLIDALYEADVIVVIRASSTPQHLFVADKSVEDDGDLIGDGTYVHKGARDEAFAFDRTASRIIEMGSTQYLSRVKRGQRVGDVLLTVDDDHDVDALFTAADVDGSGQLDEHELRALLEELSSTTRGHRNVARLEFELARDSLDANRDGLIDLHELRAEFAARKLKDASDRLFLDNRGRLQAGAPYVPRSQTKAQIGLAPPAQ